MWTAVLKKKLEIMSTSMGRRKRAAPKPDPTPAPVVDVNAAAPRSVMFAASLPIAVCRAAAVAAEADCIPDPPRTAVAPVDLAEAMAARMRTQLPKRIPHAKIVTSLTTAAHALVQRAASVAVDVLAPEWPRAVEAERVRHAAPASGTGRRRTWPVSGTVDRVRWR